jgi:hypothetical protein
MGLGQWCGWWQAFLEYRDDILNCIGILGISLTKTKQIGYGLVRAVQKCNAAVMVSQFCGSQP